MQAFKRLFYCFYELLTIAFMVCEAAKPLRGRSPGPRPKRSEVWTQVNDRAKEKKNRPIELHAIMMLKIIFVD